MTNDRKAPRLVADAQAPWAGGDLFIRSAGGNSSHSAPNSITYCHLVGRDGTEDVWACASTAADAVAQTGDFYRTKSPPQGALRL